MYKSINKSIISVVIYHHLFLVLSLNSIVLIFFYSCCLKEAEKENIFFFWEHNETFQQPGRYSFGVILKKVNFSPVIIHIVLQMCKKPHEATLDMKTMYFLEYIV